MPDSPAVTAAAQPAAPEHRTRFLTPVDAVRPERRPSDFVALAIGAVGVVLAGMWAQSSNNLDTNLFKVINGLPNSFDGLANAFAFLGSIWFVGIVVVALLVGRWSLAARDAAIGGGGAWLLARGFNALFGTRSAHSLGITVRTGSGPSFPVAAVATATALVIVLSPYLTRPLRRVGFLVIVPVALSAMYLGTGLASDVVGGFLLGVAVAAVVHIAFGAPGGRPTAAQIRDALKQLGFDVADLHPAETEIARATKMDAQLASGDAVQVLAFGRDQRDGQLVARLWHLVMYRAPGVPVFGTRLQQVEHLAYALLLADNGGVRSPHVLKTGIAGPDAALLVTSRGDGQPLASLDAEVTDAVVGAVWSELGRLHGTGVAHGDLGPECLRVDADGRVGFEDVGIGYVGTESYWCDRDVAATVVITARLVGNGRATKAAVAALGRERLGAVIPLIQPAALPGNTTRGEKHLGKTLKELRSDLVAATGVEDVAPLKVRRLSLVNIGMLAGILLALAIAIPSLEGINWSSVQQEFTNATWGWAVLALILYPLVPMAWATALLGCVNEDLPFVPTALTQLACTFLNLITPNGIGGTALQLDYLHHQDVPVASGASAMVLSTGVGGLIQMVLFLIAAALTATTVDTSSSGPGVTLGGIAVVAALIGVILWIPKIRQKVVPAVKRAASDIWAVLRNPKKGAQLLGGDLAGNLIYPGLLGLCLLAFGHSLSFAQLIVVQVGAGMLGNVAPVPGGIGVQEAALTAGLTSFGIPTNPALATVIVFRAVTFAIPPIVGFFTLRGLRRRGYA
jgi:uncharacterized membrane protein YbhN (UPF0104 family)/membrane-associated phospholipid phosphatase